MIIRSFCLRLSIRLGSLLVAAAYLVGAFGMVVMSAVWLASDPASTERIVKSYTSEYRLLYVGSIIHRISRDPSPFRELTFCTSCCRVLVCAAAIYGAYYMKPFYLLPFLVVELVRFAFFMFLHITAMQIVKENSQDLGSLICWTLLGSLILFFMLYFWVCVYSLYKVLRRIQGLSTDVKVLVRSEVRPAVRDNPTRLYPGYFPTYTSPIAPVY